MEANLDEIARELVALTQRFIDLGASLEEAARASSASVIAVSTGSRSCRLPGSA